MRPQSDTAFVMGFGGDVKLWQDSTANREELIDAIARLKQPGWGTRFFDALYSACVDRPSGNNRGQLVHRAMVVLTDGDDTQSIHTLGNAIAAAQRNEIQIYALTIHPPGLAGRGDRILQRLADATGGRLYVAASSRELNAAFAQIEQDLRTQYYVSFPPQQADAGISLSADRSPSLAEAGSPRPPGLLRHGGVRRLFAVRYSLFATRCSPFAFRQILNNSVSQRRVILSEDFSPSRRPL